MIVNGNGYKAVNDLSKVAFIPTQIMNVLIEDQSKEANDFWKLLCLSREDCLDVEDLTEDEKIAAIWQGDSLENNYHVFYKPLIGSALDSAQAQTQMRLYRTTTQPNSNYEAIINFEIDLITNEKESMVRCEGYYVERTDLMESLLLSILNGRDLGLGTGTLSFDKNLSRSCGSALGINNSKTFYGRSLTLGLRFMSAETDINVCG